MKPITKQFEKDPGAVLDYVMNWVLWLGTDTISSSEWVEESGITVDSDTNTTTSATVWLSGGDAGASYKVVNRIVTSAGRANGRTINIKVCDQ